MSPSVPHLDWSACALCQKGTKESLICPARRDGDGYRYISENLQQFQELGVSPVDTSFELLDEGDGFENTFRRNKACWHKTCWSKVSKNKLQRKRKKLDTQESPVKTRRISGGQSTSNKNIISDSSLCQDVPLCFFCEGPSGCDGLHEAWTLELDNKVRSHVHYLNDSHL